MFRRAVRKLLSPLIRWAVRYADIGLAMGRDSNGIFIEVELPFDAEYLFRFEVDDARKWGRAMLRLARDEQEGSPLPKRQHEHETED